jgi:hypothetical protein
LLSVIHTSISVSVSEHTLGESLVINDTSLIILLVSDDVINTLELLEEDGDNLINDLDVISESIDLRHVPVSVLLELNLSLLNSSDGVLPSLLSLSFHLLGKDEIVLELGGISGVSVEFDLEDVGLFLRFLDEGDGVSTGSDLSLDKVIHGGLEVDNELIESDHKLTNDGLLGVISLVGHLLKFLGFSLVINVIVTDLLSSSSGLSLIGEGKEGVEGFSLEEVGVSRKLVERWHLLDLGKRNWHTLGFPVSEVLLEEVNSGEGFIVLSDSGDEDKGSITSLILELSNEGGDLGESVVDEVDVVGGVNHLLLDELSVGNSSIIDTSVGVHDGGEVTDSLGESGFGLIVSGIKGSSLIEGRLSESVEDIHDGVDGITGLFLQLHELSELGGEEFGVGNSQDEDESNSVFHCS